MKINLASKQSLVSTSARKKNVTKKIETAYLKTQLKGIHKKFYDSVFEKGFHISHDYLDNKRGKKDYSEELAAVLLSQESGMFLLDAFAFQFNLEEGFTVLNKKGEAQPFSVIESSKSIHGRNSDADRAGRKVVKFLSSYFSSRKARELVEDLLESGSTDAEMSATEMLFRAADYDMDKMATV